ncbi:MAG: 50S ribosomal protein L6, partial [Thiotrichales bacterium]|nr:50S ribosomal protein L6 [Thiotrichales bacterium]
ANNPVKVPSGVDVNITDTAITVKGSKGEMSHRIHRLVSVAREDGNLTFRANNNSKTAKALSGTTRAVVQNLVTGVSDGFERKLEINGIGYRAQAQGKVLNLTLGFSHPVNYPIPEGITIETPSQTEIVIKGMDKQMIGQVAAEIRAYRPPEPYKGKGVKYSDERIVRKEAKKS